jgi:hypothetical protein
MMRDLRDRNDKRIGFIDPYVIYKDTVTLILTIRGRLKWKGTSGGSCITTGTEDQYSSPITWGKVLLSCAHFILLSQSSIKIYILTDL